MDGLVEVTIKYNAGPTEVVQVPKNVADEFTESLQDRTYGRFYDMYHQKHPALTARLLSNYRPEHAFQLHPHIYTAARTFTTRLNDPTIWERYRKRHEKKKNRDTMLFRLCDGLYDFLKNGELDRELLYRYANYKKAGLELIGKYFLQRYNESVFMSTHIERFIFFLLQGISPKKNHVNAVGHYVRNGFSWNVNWVEDNVYSVNAELNKLRYNETRKLITPYIPHLKQENLPMLQLTSSCSRENPWYKLWESEPCGRHEIWYDGKFADPMIVDKVTHLYKYIVLEEESAMLPVMRNLVHLQIDVAGFHHRDLVKSLPVACPSLTSLQLSRDGIFEPYNADYDKQNDLPLVTLPLLKNYYYHGRLLFYNIINVPNLTHLTSIYWGSSRPCDYLKYFAHVRHLTLSQRMTYDHLKWIGKTFKHLETLDLCSKPIIVSRNGIKSNEQLPKSADVLRALFVSPNLYKFTMMRKCVFDDSPSIREEACFAFAYSILKHCPNKEQRIYLPLLPGILLAAFEFYPPSSTSNLFLSNNKKSRMVLRKRKR